MQLSKHDMFCENMSTSSAAKASENVIDFGAHGDDILGKLFWSLFVDSISDDADAADKDFTVIWETSDSEGFGSDTDLFTKTIPAASVVKGAYLVKNEPLPKGLKRYNRLKFSESTGTKCPNVTAFVHDARDEGTPFQGLL